MKFALEWSIKIFWAMIGIICAYTIITILQHVLSGQFPPTGSFWISSLVVFLYAVPMLGIFTFCALLIYFTPISCGSST